MVVQKIVEFCKLPKVLPWLCLLDTAMEKYEMIVHQNKKETKPMQYSHLLRMKEKVAACNKRAMDGHDIKQEAETLAQEAESSAQFAQEVG